MDIYNLLNNNVTLQFNPTSWRTRLGNNRPQTYMNPRLFCLNAELAWKTREATLSTP